MRITVIHGTAPFGRIFRSSGEVVATLFYHVWFFALIPLGSVELDERGRPVRRISLHLPSLLLGWLRGLGFVLGVVLTGAAIYQLRYEPSVLVAYGSVLGAAALLLGSVLSWFMPRRRPRLTAAMLTTLGVAVVLFGLAARAISLRQHLVPGHAQETAGAATPGKQVRRRESSKELRYRVNEKLGLVLRALNRVDEVKTQRCPDGRIRARRGRRQEPLLVIDHFHLHGLTLPRTGSEGPRTYMASPVFAKLRGPGSQEEIDARYRILDRAPYLAVFKPNRNERAAAPDGRLVLFDLRNGQRQCATSRIRVRGQNDRERARDFGKKAAKELKYVTSALLLN